MIYGIECKYAEQTERHDVILCKIGRFGGRPHIAVCFLCLRGEPDSGPPPPPEEPCEHRGEVTREVPCCAGKTRPVAYACSHEKTPHEVTVNVCNSIGCNFY